jgi:hypothetical protein
MEINNADVAELVDARDLKSLDGNVVWVRVPPPAPEIETTTAMCRQQMASPMRRLGPVISAQDAEMTKYNPTNYQLGQQAEF